MRTLICTLALTLSTAVFADSFSCYSTIDMENSKRLITVSETSVEIEGMESKPILETRRAKLFGGSLKKCANKSPASQYKCLNKLVPRAKEGDSVMSMYNVLLQMVELEPDPHGVVGTVSSLDVATRNDLDVRRVAEGVVYVTKFGSYYANSGVYEFFDVNGVSLGRFFMEGFVRNCR